LRREKIDYEKGDKYAEIVQKKFFEYYGMHPTAGGRRTAAIIAAQYLRRLFFTIRDINNDLMLTDMIDCWRPCKKSCSIFIIY